MADPLILAMLRRRVWKWVGQRRRRGVAKPGDSNAGPAGPFVVRTIMTTAMTAVVGVTQTLLFAIRAPALEICFRFSGREQ